MITNTIIDTLKLMAGLILQFSQAIAQLAGFNVATLITSGYTLTFTNPFGVPLPDIALLGWGDFGQSVVDLFELIPAITLDVTVIELLFVVAVITLVIRLFRSVTG